MNTGRDGRSENCPEILRVLYSVERKKKPGLHLLCGILKDRVLRGIGLSRHHGNHALMIAGGDQPIESFTRLNLQGNTPESGKTNDL